MGFAHELICFSVWLLAELLVPGDLIVFFFSAVTHQHQSVFYLSFLDRTGGRVLQSPCRACFLTEVASSLMPSSGAPGNKCQLGCQSQQWL